MAHFDKEAFDSKPTEDSVHKAELTMIAKGAGVTFFGQVIEFSVKYIYLILVAIFLGAASFGLFALSLTIVNITGVFSRLGLENGVIRYISLYNGINDMPRVKGTIAQGIKLTIVSGIITSIILFFAANTLSTGVFHKPGLAGVIKVLLLSIPFMSLTIVALSCTCGFKIMKYRAISQSIFLPIMNLLLVLFFLMIGFGLRGVLISHVLSTFLASILSIYFIHKVFPAIPNIHSVTQTAELVKYSLPLLVVLLLNSMMMWTDTLMLGYFKTLEHVGIYSVTMKTAMLTAVMLACFNSIFSPIISDLYNQKQTEKLSNLFKTVTKWIFSATFPLFLLIGLFPKEILSVFGPEFIAGYISLIILAFAQLVNAGSGPVAFMLAMTGRQKYVMYLTCTSCVLNIVLNYLLIPAYGIIGAAMASGISVIILNLLFLITVYRTLKMQPYTLDFIRPAIIGGVVFIIFSYLKFTLGERENILTLIIGIPLFLGVYSAIVYKWGTNEKDMVVIDVFKQKFAKVLDKR